MAVYAIGDLHGCFSPLKDLLEAIAFDRKRDRLWFVGDLINRGPDSLQVLRFLTDLGDRAVAVMGNHDLHLLGTLARGVPFKAESRLADLLSAPDFDDLHRFVRTLPFMHRDEELGWHMVHAGLHPSWSLEEAYLRARGLAEVIQDDATALPLFTHLLQPIPEEEPPLSSPWERHCFELAVFTRTRLCTPEGRFSWPFSPTAPSADLDAWYEVRQWAKGEQVVYGHWAAARLRPRPHTFGLDAGCIYGGGLAALRLDVPGRMLTHVPSVQVITPGES